MRECICNNCGMEFTIQKLNKQSDTMKDGNDVEVLSFTCPKCDERYIVTVRDDYSGELQKELEYSQDRYRNGYDKHNPNNEERLAQAQREVKINKKRLYTYMNRLKKRYIKELKRREQKSV